jgi:predicted phage tail protein
MLRKVKLYGELADFIGYKELDAVINSTADAIRFLVSNFPKLEAHMADRYYKVLVDNYEIDETEIHHPIGQSDISIVPVITGAGGVGKTLLGVAMIGIAIAAPGAGFMAGGGLGFAGAGAMAGKFSMAAMIGNFGIALTLMGVSEMLFPVPKSQDFSNEEDPRISFGFSGVQNTSRAGTTHPIVYGEIVTGSVVISAGIDTNQVSA